MHQVKHLKPTSSDSHAARTEHATSHQQRISQVLFAIIAVILVVAVLKITASVTFPLVFALFLTAIFWPLQRSLAQRMPRGVAVVLSLLAFLLVVGCFAGLLWLSGVIVVQGWQPYSERFATYQQQAQGWLQSVGLTMPGDTSNPSAGSDIAQPVLTRVGSVVGSILGTFVLVSAFLIFGLLETPDFQTRLKHLLPDGEADAWLDAIHNITRDFQRYIVVRSAIGVITGTGVTLFAWLIGLDFALIWGLTNFLLNYIPTLGSIVAVVPPVLFGLVQFQSISMALVVLLGVGGVQLIMGQYVDPLLQGKYLALSPLVVLLSVTFWGWLWGIGGAFIGVPLTIGIVIACRHFDRTRWIATLLAEVPDEPDVTIQGEV
jgi:predicted PurR-regulated permease PerM